MRLRIPTVASLVLSLGVGTAHAHSKKLSVPPVFQTAHSVFVECVDGDADRPGVSVADRTAIREVQEGLKEWNRYTLVDSPEKADLVIVVRKGHAVGDADHLGLGPQPKAIEPPPPPGQPMRPPTAGGNTEYGSAAMGGDDIAEQDMLRVYTVNQKGRLKGPIWSRQMDGGLDGPSVRLFQELKAAVEITYPSQAAQQSAQ